MLCENPNPVLEEGQQIVRNNSTLSPLLCKIDILQSALVRRMLRKLWPLVLLIASMPFGVQAENPYDNIRYNREEEFQFDESLVKKWKEETGEIPAPPLDNRGLVKMSVRRLGDDFKVMVDPKSLNVGKEDYVVRYWLVVEGKLGAVNTTYEGIRCSTNQFKIYAYASRKKNGKISEMKKAKWLPLKGIRGNDFHEELALDFFCDFGSPRLKKEILARMKESSIHIFMEDKSSGTNPFF